ncbi:MAG TPA: PTS sugar transporter subunit IIC, partial [bacterium]|nr:PTS sugar transporter subunit IIC [bacterium]
MLMETLIILAACALGALLLLDNNVLFQGMLSRPIVTGAVFGALLSDSLVPLFVGTMLELVWANVIPLGEQRRPSATFMGALCAIVLSRWPGGWHNRPVYEVLAAC